MNAFLLLLLLRLANVDAFFLSIILSLVYFIWIDVYDVHRRCTIKTLRKEEKNLSQSTIYTHNVYIEFMLLYVNCDTEFELKAEQTQVNATRTRRIREKHKKTENYHVQIKKNNKIVKYMWSEWKEKWRRRSGLVENKTNRKKFSV